jgi:CRISPR-associated Csx2 family protein
MHTLITFLGRGSADPGTGYREAVYRFPDGTVDRTSFFGLALARHLRPDRIVVLGTSGSMWGALVEHAAAADEAETEARLALIDAEAAGAVDQALLDRLSAVLRRAAGREVAPRLIPFGRTEAEQRAILQAIADSVGGSKVSFDLTHGFRHLGMIGMLSAFMLERIGKLAVQSLWYGALDMSAQGETPVLRLDGLGAIQRWVDALDRFDAGGDYGVFAPLLEADGVPADKARCLEAAAFFERTFNLGAAAQKLGTFRAVLASPLPGASGLFQGRLAERLQWIGEKDLAAQQHRLAAQYLERADFVRAAVFAWEAVISRECKGYELHRHEIREQAERALDEKFRAKDCDRAQADAFFTLRNLRNALAHGTPPQDERCRTLLRAPERLHPALRGAVDTLLA